eukprot:5194191-Alexandrium_andersonii.AAC.1
MSASLVGSEMCIRDRMGTTARFGGLLPMASLLGKAGHKSVPRQDVVAVSYTHLTLPTICSV